MEILLGRDDINPDKPDEEGRTPLWGAAGGGHEGVVEILLGHGDFDLNKRDMFGFGQTPLYCAASKGYAGVVGILLERDDISPDESDISGETPLLCSARRGHESSRNYNVIYLLTALHGDAAHHGNHSKIKCIF